MLIFINIFKCNYLNLLNNQLNYHLKVIKVILYEITMSKMNVWMYPLSYKWNCNNYFNFYKNTLKTAEKKYIKLNTAGNCSLKLLVNYKYQAITAAAITTIITDKLLPIWKYWKKTKAIPFFAKIRKTKNYKIFIKKTRRLWTQFNTHSPKTHKLCKIWSKKTKLTPRQP